MRKIFLLSFDDGVIWDQWFIEMLNHYGVPCTFNLNSGLEDFVWHYGPHPIRRLRLAENKHIYDGHEIASHTLHHNWLDAQTDEQLSWEVSEDVRRLKLIFGKEKLGFAVPFTACGEREVAVIKPHVSYIRLSQESDSFALPKDPYHIPISSLYNDPRVREKIKAFAENDLDVSVFVLVGHTYEFEVLHQWGMVLRVRYIFLPMEWAYSAAAKSSSTSKLSAAERIPKSLPPRYTASAP